MKNPYRSTAHGIARIGVGRVSKPKVYKPPRPYTRRPRVTTPRINEPTAPITQTPTITGTGVTTTSGGSMPGAPDTGGLPAIYQAPKIKNWAKATPAQMAQAMLAPEYASIYAQQHQSQLIAGQQRSAITSYGAELAKILGEAGPAGVKGTLGPEYAAALSMANLRQFAYTQFLESQKYADEYAQVAAKYPTYLNQLLAQKADQKLKQDAFNLQKLVAVQTYHLNQQKTKLYGQKAVDQSKQAWARIGISQQNAQIAMKRYGLSEASLKLQIAKENRIVAQYNQGRTDKQNQINYSASRAAGRWVNSAGKPLNLPYANPIKIGTGGNKSDKNNNRRGLTDTQYRNAYGKALTNATAARNQGASRSDYMTQAVMNGVPRWVAAKAWMNAKPKKIKPFFGSGG